MFVRNDPTLFFTLDQAADLGGAAYCPVCGNRRLVYASVLDERSIFAQAASIAAGEPTQLEWVCPDGCRNPATTLLLPSDD